MDPLLPRHVLFLSSLPGLVRQLTQLAHVDSIRQETVWLWHISHKDWTTTLRLNVTACRAGPGVQSALHEDSVLKWRRQLVLF